MSKKKRSMITDSNQACLAKMTGRGVQEVFFGNKKGRAELASQSLNVLKTGLPLHRKCRNLLIAGD